MRPRLPAAADLLGYLQRIDEARWYSNFGPLSDEFAQRLGDVLAESGFGDTSVLPLASATQALELTLKALLRGKTSPLVLIPSFTFVATGQAVLNAGAVPKIADVDPDSWLLTPEMARDIAAQHPIDAVLPVAALGNPVDLDAWEAFHKDTGIPVLIDAAGSFGNQAVGSLPVVFSFHATKALASGEGGCLCTQDQALLAQVRQMANFGIDMPTGEATLAGGNAKMSEYHAAVGLAALDGWADVLAARQVLHRLFSARIGAIDGIHLQKRSEHGCYTIFPVRFKSVERRMKATARMAAEGVEFRSWYCPPLHRSRHFLAGSGGVPLLPVTDNLVATFLCLPFHLDLDAEHLARIASCLEG
jgi:dTDP-4-amino-4,6-dideoxygalactose transaminase